MAKRKALSKTARFEVFKRDGFRCLYCGASPPDALLQVDHLIAVANGGGNHIDNLVTSCQPCNLGKGVRSLSVAPQSLADKAKEVAEREEQLLGYQSILESRRLRLEDEAWRVLEAVYGRPLETVPRDEFTSTRKFIERLGYHSCLDAAEIAIAAATRKTFRYFCGICWNRVRELQDGKAGHA